MKLKKNVLVPKGSEPKPKAAARKLSFKELRELEILPGKIEALDTQQIKIVQMMEDPLFYQKDPKEIAQIKLQLAEAAENLSKSYQRWEYLEGLKQALLNS